MAALWLRRGADCQQRLIGKTGRLAECQSWRHRILPECEGRGMRASDPHPLWTDHLPRWSCCLSGLSSGNRSDREGVRGIGRWEREVGKDWPSGREDESGTGEKMSDWKSRDTGIRAEGIEAGGWLKKSLKRLKWGRDDGKGLKAECEWFLLGILKAT